MPIDSLFNVAGLRCESVQLVNKRFNSQANKGIRRSLVLGSILAISCAQGPLASPLSIKAHTLSVLSGQIFSVNVDVVGATDLYAYEFDVNFDPSILMAVSSGEGSFLASGGTTVFASGAIDNFLGTVSFISNTLIGTIPGVNGDGMLATLSFKALSGGLSYLDMTSILALDSNLSELQAGASSGAVTVSAVPEPSILPLILAGLVGVGLYSIRRRGT